MWKGLFWCKKVLYRLTWMFKNHVRQIFLLLLKNNKQTNKNTRKKILRRVWDLGLHDIFAKRKIARYTGKDMPEHPHLAFYWYILQSTFSQLQLMKSVMAHMLLGTEQAEHIPSVLNPPFWAPPFLQFLMEGTPKFFSPSWFYAVQQTSSLDYVLLLPQSFFLWETFLFSRYKSSGHWFTLDGHTAK